MDLQWGVLARERRKTLSLFPHMNWTDLIEKTADCLELSFHTCSTQPKPEIVHERSIDRLRLAWFAFLSAIVYVIVSPSPNLPKKSALKLLGRSLVSWILHYFTILSRSNYFVCHQPEINLINSYHIYCCGENKSARLTLHWVCSTF